MKGIELQGAGALVTGASSGIGRATALRLAEAGARVAVAARRESLLHALADQAERRGGVRPVVLPGDLARPGEARRLAGAASAALGDVDILVNNAGGGVGGTQWSVGDGEVGRAAFELNYCSPLALVQELVPRMRARGRGAVVNVTSMAQVASWPGFGGYAATKAALALSTVTLQSELAGSGVLVVEVVPGPVDTAVQGESRLLPGFDRMVGRTPLGDADVLARHVVRALRRGRTRVVYPQRLRAGYWLPGLARWYTHRLATRSWLSLDADTRERVMTMVVRSGSQGDAVAREARDAWERAHARA